MEWVGGCQLHSIIHTNKLHYRLGQISFINTLPIDYPLLLNYSFDDLIQSYPSKLNHLLKEKYLDLAPISSFEYLCNKDNYSIIDNLSISSKTQADSVIFVTNDLENLSTIYLTNKSATSVALLKIILKKNYSVNLDKINFVNFADNANYPNKLLIGDEALKLPQNQFKYRLDLGEEWYKLTQLPMVFALWSFYKNTNVSNLERILLESKDLGLGKNFPDVIVEAFKLTGLSKIKLSEYFSHLDYDFKEKHKESLRIFEAYAKDNLNAF